MFIAKGNGVTIEYIISKGSACVEAFRRVSHMMAEYFGDPDRRRKSKEASFQEDMHILVEELDKKELGGEYKTRLVPVIAKGQRAARLRAKGVSAITDVLVAGSEIWAAKFAEWKRQTTYDPALGYIGGDESNDPVVVALNNGSVFDNPSQLHLTRDGNTDLGLLADTDMEGVGGGDDYDAGEND